MYRLLHPLYARYKSWAETVGVCPPRERHYQGWYDAYVDQDGFDRSRAGLEPRRPDFLVVSDLYYGRYESDPTSTAGRFYADLLAGRSNYDEVATFKQGLLPWSDPQPEYINPMIRIFQRQRGAMRSVPHRATAAAASRTQAHATASGERRSAPSGCAGGSQLLDPELSRVTGQRSCR